MTKITQLTPEQIAQLPVYRERFIRAGLSTEPADWEAAENAIRDAYRVAGLEPPAIFVRLASPISGAIAATMLLQVRDQVRAQVRDQVSDQVRAQVGRAGYGQHDISWLSFYAFFAACRLKAADRISPLVNLAGAAGWWWPFAGLCIVTDRPAMLMRDDANRLHAEHGPALRYRDGWSMYAWHGYRLPQSHEWIIREPERLTVAGAMSEPNAELRRIMLEKLGWDRVISESRATVLDEDTNHRQPRRLLEIDAGGERLRVMHVVNGSLEPDGSRREFFLGAMNDANTAHEAVAMSYGRAPRSYAEAGRT